VSRPTVAPDVLDEAFVRDFVERWHAAWNSKDPARVAELCTADVELVDPTMPAPVHGIDGIRRTLGPLARAFPNFRFTSTEEPFLSRSGARVVMPWQFAGTMTGPLQPPGFAPTGGVVSFEGHDVWDFRDGRVSRMEALFDVNGVAVQIGAAPAPGSGGERVGVWLQRAEAWRRRRAARG
jgi:steroid delta-isomerase-like uncharacterized protein